MQPSPHDRSFATRPLLTFACSFAAGITSSHFGLFGFRSLVLGAVASTALALVALSKSRLRLATLLIISSIYFAGALLVLTEKWRPPGAGLKALLAERSIAYDEALELEGVLERPPQFGPDRLYLTLAVERIRFRGSELNASGLVGLVVLIDAEHSRHYGLLGLHYRERLRVKTKLAGADRFRNPGVNSFTEYLERRGYDATGFVKSPLQIERLGNAPAFRPLVWLYQYRQSIESQINMNFSADTAGVLNAALLGNRYYLSQPTATRFRDGGTYHVLVISGLHISFIGGLVFLASRKITRSQVVRFLLSVAVLWIYVIAVGAEASVVRAALMFTIVALGPVLNRQGDSLNALGGAAFALLIWQPGNLLDPSFQLTFLSVLAILVLAWPILRSVAAIGSWHPTRATPYPPACAPWFRTFCECLFWSERSWRGQLARENYSYRLFKAPMAGWLDRFWLQPLLRYGFGAMVVSSSVQIMLLPVLILYFHRVSIASIFLNIGVSVLMAALGLVAVSGLLIVQVSSSLAAPLFNIANFLNWLMVHSIDPFQSLGIASLRIPEYSGWSGIVYPIYYLPLLFFARMFSSGRGSSPGRRKRPWPILAATGAQVFVLMWLILHPLSVGRLDGKLHVDFLDVGQGDAALLTAPDGTTLLVDGGGRPRLDLSAAGNAELFERDTPSIGEAVVSEYLWWRGLDTVDYLLATHADADHIDGLADVARNFEVRAALVARVPAQDPEFKRFSETLRSQSIPVRLVGSGDILRLGAVTISVLWPTPNENPSAPSANNDSMVLRLALGQCSVLLTGDIERRAEAAILLRQADLRGDVVKVPHHGSKTSSTVYFVKATHARFAIISVGQTSIFGHPSAEVVKRWRASGAEVLTTGKSGTISVMTDGRLVELQTFSQ